MSFEIKLPLFEGPFDLLLFFIESNEIDIYDIPISSITDDFLDYIHTLEELNIEVASEFILVAATLMKIKARMLLPKDESAEGAEDPRTELVNYLLEYKKYKSVLDFFMEAEKEQLKQEKRGNVVEELKKIAQESSLELEMDQLDLYKLLKIYEQVLNEAKERENEQIHTILPYPFTVAGQKEYLTEQIRIKKKLSFREIIFMQKTKIAVIFNFLAILELLQNRFINLLLDEGFNNFWIEENPTVDQLSLI